MSFRLKKSTSRSGRLKRRFHGSQRKTVRQGKDSPRKADSPVSTRASKKFNPVVERKRIWRQAIGIVVITLLIATFIIATELWMSVAQTPRSDRFTRPSMSYRGAVIVTSNLDCSLLTRTCMMKKKTTLSQCAIVALVCLSHMKDDVIAEDRNLSYAYSSFSLTDSQIDREGKVDFHPLVYGISTGQPVINFGKIMCKKNEQINARVYYKEDQILEEYAKKHFVANYENLKPRDMMVENRQIPHGQIVYFNNSMFKTRVADPLRNIFDVSYRAHNSIRHITAVPGIQAIQLGGVQVRCVRAKGCQFLLTILKTAYGLLESDRSSGEYDPEKKELYAAHAVFRSTKNALWLLFKKKEKRNETAHASRRMPILVEDAPHVNTLISMKDPKNPLLSHWEVFTISSLKNSYVPQFVSPYNSTKKVAIDFATHLVIINNTEITYIMVDAQSIDRFVEGLLVTALRAISYEESLEELARRPRHFFYSFAQRQCQLVNTALWRIQEIGPEIKECQDVTEISSRSLTIVRYVQHGGGGSYEVIKEEDDNYNYVVGF